MTTTNTPYSSKCDILGRLWIDFRDDEQFVDFIEYNDLGLPMSYFISEGIVQSTPLAEGYINETFDLFLAALNITDTGFTTLEEVLTTAHFREE
jgi:hypothetical protein